MNIMRNHFTIKMAGLIIEIDSVSPRACIHCMHYLHEGNPDFCIKVTEEDIDREYKESDGCRHNAVSAETTAVYRKIVEKLIDYDVILMHGAVIAVGENAYMFSAPSGTGKTTHIKLWLRNVKDSFVINGDKPLIRINKDNLIACGTPWSGNEGMGTNTMLPLKSIVFMERSEENSIREIPFSQAYPYIIRQTYLPRDNERAKRTLSLVSSMYGKASFWLFSCNNFAPDCFMKSYNALINDGK